jgi:hypothetical protein
LVDSLVGDIRDCSHDRLVFVLDGCERDGVRGGVGLGLFFVRSRLEELGFGPYMLAVQTCVSDAPGRVGLGGANSFLQTLLDRQELPQAIVDGLVA